jgi:RND family efflux transporter MFP subunit
MHSLSLPIFRDDRVEAVFTLERDQAPFNAGEQDFAEAATGLAGGMLLHRAAEEQWFTARLRQRAKAVTRPVWGEGHSGVKLVLLLLVGTVVALSLLTGPFRIHAPTTVEGGQLRAMAAPFSGYLASAEARAGDRVEAGQLLAALDDHDLRLERIQTDSEIARFERERQQAAADRDRAKGRILDAQLKQAQARLRLLNIQLERSRLLAPFDGLIVSGDQSRSLGKPVERGEVLFELAPQGEYRLALQLDERDVRFVETGQQGTLLLGALPNQPIPFQVSRITPMTESADGRTFYRAEGELEEIPPQLRPGMEGIGKIHIGEAKLVWQWSRGLLHWLRTWYWSWSL